VNCEAPVRYDSAAESAAAAQLCQAELLRLSGGALREHDVDEGGAAEVHRLVEGAAQILGILDIKALGAEGLL